ncbi:SH3 domain-containing protein (plasmid) [Thermanaerothrix sp. 4228-RoL]|jgi:hypothetical protein|uniref:SH3 domain-containing protein n=1 Tax=Thermanaerothrix solaris TaxID=3058434 RepID=A0ABU3NRV7_9CHLR|nr:MULTISPECIES: SH3 domain-containing protein [unclassified Thermanaerothrix]MDT8899554.1 SH3 domain-containing protein [Thermanaerothrix sp. 4228-RoL]
MRSDIFRAYLQRRYQAAGAVTPEQQLAVIDTLIEEARQGIVPIDTQHVARLDPQDPAVQAVLRGEDVVVSGRRTLKPQGDWRSRVSELPTSTKFLLLAVIGLLPSLFGLWLIFSGFSKPSSPSTPTDTAPLVLQVTPSGEATIIDQRSMIAPNSVQDMADVPVSLEIGDLRILLQPRSLDDDTGFGTRMTDWKPKGAEWLVGSRVRRVIAVPQTMLSPNSVTTGQPVTLRYQNGNLVSFVVTFVGKVSVDQIEVMRSNVPSLAIILVSDDPVWRYVLIAEQSDLILAATQAALPTPIPPKTAVTQRSVRLRDKPSLSAQVLRTLEPNTTVVIVPGQEAVSADNYVWVYVSVDGLNGWVVSNYLK